MCIFDCLFLDSIWVYICNDGNGVSVERGFLVVFGEYFLGYVFVFVRVMVVGICNWDGDYYWCWWV